MDSTRTYPITEDDPYGTDQHSAGAKLDRDKPRPALVLGAFANALGLVTQVGTFGATKYSDNGWLSVPMGYSRYEDAKLRHWLARQRGELIDSDSGLPHLAHEAWNVLATLELYLRGQEDGEDEST